METFQEGNVSRVFMVLDKPEHSLYSSFKAIANKKKSFNPQNNFYPLKKTKNSTRPFHLGGGFR